MSENMLTLAQVRARTGLSKTTIYAGIKAGTFPAPAKYGVASRWFESEIDAWIQALKDSRGMGSSMGELEAA